MHHTLSEGRTTLGDGDIWILHDLEVPKGRCIFIESGGVSNQNGKVPEGLSVDIFDKSNNNIRMKVESQYKDYINPQKLSLGGRRVMIRLRNQTGNTQDVTGYVTFEINK